MPKLKQEKKKNERLYGIRKSEFIYTMISQLQNSSSYQVNMHMGVQET